MSFFEIMIPITLMTPKSSLRDRWRNQFSFDVILVGFHELKVPLDHFTKILQHVYQWIISAREISIVHDVMVPLSQRIVWNLEFLLFIHNFLNHRAKNMWSIQRSLSLFPMGIENFLTIVFDRNRIPPIRNFFNYYLLLYVTNFKHYCLIR